MEPAAPDSATAAGQPTAGQSPALVVGLDPSTRRVMGQAATEALGLGHNYIGTEHLLLGLMRDPSRWAAQAPALQGVGAGEVREAVVALLDLYLRERG